ncbi:hypothetical protein LDENG_00273750, partial [Lucifuga dentata]
VYPVFTLGIIICPAVCLCVGIKFTVFCSNWSVVQLSCVDTTVNSIAGRVVTIPSIFIPLGFVLYTYLPILLVCRKSSTEFRGKAMQTCLPHIVTFMNYCISVFCEISLSRYTADEINAFVTVVLSLEFFIIPPNNNPVVYGLNLPQISKNIFRHLKMPKMISPA